MPAGQTGAQGGNAVARPFDVIFSFFGRSGPTSARVRGTTYLAGAMEDVMVEDYPVCVSASGDFVSEQPCTSGLLEKTWIKLTFNRVDDGADTTATRWVTWTVDVVHPGEGARYEQIVF